MHRRSIRETLLPGFTSALAALLLAGAVGAVAPEAEPRNHDARVDYNKGFVAHKSALQTQALDALRSEVRDLAVTFDETTGVTRTLSSHTGYLTDGFAAGGDPMAAATSYVTSHLSALGISAEDLAGYEVTDSVYSRVSGATHIYLRQTHLGLPVYNAQLHVNVDRDGRIISVNNAFVPNLASAVGSAQPSLGADESVAAAALHLGLQLRAMPAVLDHKAGHQQLTVVSGDGISVEPVRARLMWLPVRAGEVRLVWNFEVQTLDHQHWYDVNVDAESGEVWTRFDWVSSGTYRVYQEPDESPLHGSTGRTLVVNPEDPVSQNGWFSGGTMDGNNVHACPDASPSNNVCDSNPQCSGTTCDFPINLGNQPSSYIPAATANLFYWNNLIHDVQHQYGFDEPGGNFQENNFGLGGNGSDSVNADAQDGGGNCNANFATPTDGGNPRMQMYTCNMASPSRDGDLDNGVIVHEYGHGISIRQVGGPGNSGCLNNAQQAGEGWSDWHALVYTSEPGDAGTDSRGIGTYLFGQGPNGPGIRDLPYSTNPAVNNWTYESISGAGIPHGVGSRWAQAIWEVYWALVDEHGIEFDLHNFNINDPNEAGNKRALYYVNEGFKNTACSPTFVNNRDGIIQAAAGAFGGEDVCLLWETFAAFGLGTDAISGGSNSTNPTNGFSIPQSCSEPPPDCTNEISSQNFSSGAQGWTASGAATCSTGTFIVGTPDSTAWQPGGGNPGQAFFTQNNPGGVGTDDVDGGTCEALSPVVSGSGDMTIILDYFHGQRDAGDDGNDGFTIEVLNNGNVVDTMVSIGDVTNAANWTTASTTISNAGNVQLRVRATDAAATGDIVEGGVDNVQFCGDAGGGCTLDSQCDDGLFCNGEETCNVGTGQCQSGSDPCSGGETCNESTDTCEGGGGCLHDVDFSSGAGGWTGTTGNCSTGDFIVGTPDATAWQLGSGNPGQAFFTANNPGGVGTDDIDGGTCEALSPVINASGESAVSVSIDWYHGQRDAGDDAADGFTVEVLNNGNVVATLVNIGDVTNNPAWATASTTVNNPGNVQLRVRATDAAGPGDIVEAGIDNVQVCPDTPSACTVDDDFESGTAGWFNDGASTCSTGAYVEGNPTQVVNGGVTTQVGGSSSGVTSIFTATNSSAGVNDVDGGNCILGSPSWSVANASTLSVAYWHGQRDSGGDPSGDFFRLEYSTNGGSSWNTLVSNGDSTSNAAWATATASIPGGSTVQLRVQCSDGPASGDLVECGIDDVSICSQ